MYDACHDGYDDDDDDDDDDHDDGGGAGGPAVGGSIGSASGGDDDDVTPCYDNDILIGALVARDKIRAVASRDEDFNDTNVGGNKRLFWCHLEEVFDNEAHGS